MISSAVKPKNLSSDTPKILMSNSESVLNVTVSILVAMLSNPVESVLFRFFQMLTVLTPSCPHDASIPAVEMTTAGMIYDFNFNRLLRSIIVV